MINKCKLKRKMSIFLALSMVLVGVTACGVEAVKNEIGDTKVPENSQQNVDDIAIKEIDELQYFKSKSWLNSEEIIGISENNQIDNVCIFNSETNEMTAVTDNTDKDVTFKILGLSTIEKQLNNDYCVISKFRKSQWETSLILYSINFEDNSLKIIEEGVSDYGVLNNNKLVLAKGYEIYELNLATGEKNQIVLPNELMSKIKEIPTFEECIDLIGLSDEARADDSYMDIFKKKYQEQIESNCIKSVQKNENELMIDTGYFKNYVYHLDSKTFEEDDDCFSTYGYILDLTDENSRIQVGGSKIWKVNGNGERCEIIDEGNNISYSESLDHNKLVYFIEKDSEDEQSANKVKAYICNINSGKKVPIYGAENVDLVFWNETSNKFYYIDNVYDEENDRYKSVTSVITLN